VKSSIILTVASVFGMAGALVASVLTARALGPEAYGTVALVIASVSFGSLFFRFGVFSAAEVLIAEATDHSSIREIIGASLVGSIVLGTVFALFVQLIVPILELWFGVRVGNSLGYTIPLLVAVPMAQLAVSCSRGLGVIRYAVLVQGGAPVLNAAVVYGLHLTNAITVNNVVFAGYFVSAFLTVAVFAHLRPTLSEFYSRSRQLMSRTRYHGFPLYIGQLSDQTASALPPLVIAFFWNAAEVGFFSLAARITQLVSLTSRNLGFVYFRRLAKMTRIARSMWIANSIFLALSGVGLILLVNPAARFLYGEEFTPVVSVCYALLLAELVRGSYQLVNSFLNAHSQGRVVRIASIIMLASALPAYIVLVPPFGAVGAAAAVSIGYFSFGLRIIWSYNTQVATTERRTT